MRSYFTHFKVSIYKKKTDFFKIDREEPLNKVYAFKN